MKNDTMKIWHFSDTHTYHNLLKKPDGIDLVIFSGDCSNPRAPYINEPEVRDFLNWFASLDIKYKIMIAGNHDTSIEQKFFNKEDFTKRNIIYLENEEVIISSIEEEEEQTIKPSKLLNFYRKGYLILWDKLQSDYKSKIQFVKLIPSNSNSDIDYLLLGINISNDNISKLIEIGKNKTKTILSVDSIVFDPVLEKDIFIFNENNYKDYYIEKL